MGDKEDAERESHGIPDPFAKFTNPLERDFIRARYKWDKEKKVFYTDKITRKLIRLLEKQHQLAAESPNFFDEAQVGHPSQPGLERT